MSKIITHSGILLDIHVLQPDSIDIHVLECVPARNRRLIGGRLWAIVDAFTPWYGGYHGA
jgi:hypothetical protein